MFAGARAPRPCSDSSSRLRRGSRRRAQLVGAGLVAALALALVAPAGAGAHAVLERTDPERGAQLEAAPAEAAFFFSEPVEASFGAVRVYDRDGERVDDDELVRPATAPTPPASGCPPIFPTGSTPRPIA